MYLAKYLVLVL